MLPIFPFRQRPLGQFRTALPSSEGRSTASASRLPLRIRDPAEWRCAAAGEQVRR